MVSKLGIWMDHAEAHLIAFEEEPPPTTIINNTFDYNQMKDALSKGEKLMHNKRQQQQAAYYKELEDVIIHYDEVVLFGPTDAKTELLNILRADLHFEKIKIEVLSADKMTEHQKLAFVKAYFSKK